MRDPLLDVPDLPAEFKEFNGAWTRTRRAIDALKRTLQGRRPSYLLYNEAGNEIAANTTGQAFSTMPIIPANMAESGMLIRIKVWGRNYSSQSPTTLTLVFQIGPVAYLTKPTYTHTGDAGIPYDYTLDVDLVFIATGTNGTMLTEGISIFKEPSVLQVLHFLGPDNPVQSIDTTVPQTIRLRAYWGSAQAISLKVDRMIVEVWPPPDTPQQPQLVFALDNFLEASDTDLPDHDMDVPPAPAIGWEHQSGVGIATVEANIQRVLMDLNGASVSDPVTYSLETGYSDGTFRMGFFFDSTGNNDGAYGGIVVRWVGNGDYVMAVVQRDTGGTSKGLWIYKRVGGTFSSIVRDNFVIEADTVYNIVVTLDGEDMTASVNGRPAISAALGSTLNTTGTVHGIIFGSPNSNSTAHAIGPYTAQYP